MSAKAWAFRFSSRILSLIHTKKAIKSIFCKLIRYACSDIDLNIYNFSLPQNIHFTENITIFGPDRCNFLYALLRISVLIWNLFNVKMVKLCLQTYFDEGHFFCTWLRVDGVYSFVRYPEPSRPFYFERNLLKN